MIEKNIKAWIDGTVIGSTKQSDCHTMASALTLITLGIRLSR